MPELKITRKWPGPNRVFDPGVYAVPSQISAVHARCCVADGAGEMVTVAREAAVETEPFREPEPAAEPIAEPAAEEPSVKQPAPEDKSFAAAPENKSEVGRLRRSRDGAKPHAGGRKRG